LVNFKSFKDILKVIKIILRNGIKVIEKIKTETNPNETVSLITGVI